MSKMTFRHEWTLSVMADAELSATTRLCGVAVIMKHGKPDAGQAFWPSYESAGSLIGKSEAVGKRALLALRDRGWTRPDGHSRSGTVRYVPIIRARDQVRSDLIAATEEEVILEGEQVTCEEIRSLLKGDQVTSDLRTDPENRSTSTDPQNTSKDSHIVPPRAPEAGDEDAGNALDWEAWEKEMNASVFFQARWRTDMQRLYSDPLVENIT